MTSRSGIAGRWTLSAAVAVIAVSVAIYANGLPNEFTFDDEIVVVENETIRSLGNFVEIMTGTHWAGGVTGNLYRPVSVLSLAVNFALSEAPAGYRLVNILLHAACGILLLLIGLEWFESRSVALVAAMLFATHPIHTEAVTSIVGRAEVLAAFFSLASLLVVLHGTRDGTARRAIAPASVAAALYLLAVLSKEIAIPMIVAISAVVWLRSDRAGSGGGAARLARWLWPFAVSVLFYLALRANALGGIIEGDAPYTLTKLDNPLVDLSHGPRLATAIHVFGRYVVLLLFPVRLSADYSYGAIDVVRGLASPAALVPLLLLLTLSGLTGYALVRRQRAALALLIFLAPYLLISNLFILVGTIMGERLMYLPSVGVCMLAAQGVGWLVARRGPAPAARNYVIAGVVASVCFAFALRTIDRNRDWRDNFSLWQSSLKAAPNSSRLLHNYANQLRLQGKVGEAVKYYERALVAFPEHRSARNNLTMIYKGQKRYEEAIELLRQELVYRPGQVRPLLYLAEIYQNLERYEEMLEASSSAAALDERSVEGHVFAGIACYRLERFVEAERHLRAAVELAPTMPLLHRMLADLYGEHIIDPDKAQHHLQRALELAP